MLPTPSALLLDFGGVIVESGRSPQPEEATPGTPTSSGACTGSPAARSARRRSARRWTARRRPARGCARTPRSAWRSATSSSGELIAVEWPAVARATVLVHASDLTRQWARRDDWRLRPGIADLLDYTVGRGMPVAVVSNTPAARRTATRSTSSG
ncbi:hypothetical protein ACFQZ4_13515 [Catellatospora coxensis]